MSRDLTACGSKAQAAVPSFKTRFPVWRGDVPLEALDPTVDIARMILVCLGLK